MAPRLKPPPFEHQGHRGPVLLAQFPMGRLAPASWPRLCHRLAQLGFTGIEVPLVWAQHEVARGQFRFQDQFNISALADEAQRAGLKLWLQLGPYFDQSYPCGGIPQRVLERESLRARTAARTAAFAPSLLKAWPLPSLSAPEFFQELELFLKAAMTEMSPHLSKGGVFEGVIFNTPRLSGLRTGTLDTDHHPSAITAFREFVLKSYGSLQAVAEAWDRKLTANSDIVPPLKFSAADPLPYLLDWQAFLAWREAGALVSFKNALGSVPKHLTTSVQVRADSQNWPRPGLLLEVVDFLWVRPSGTTLKESLSIGSGTGPGQNFGIGPLALRPQPDAQAHLPSQLASAGATPLWLQVFQTDRSPGKLLDDQGDTLDAGLKTRLRQSFETAVLRPSLERGRSPEAGVLRHAYYEDLSRLGHALDPCPDLASSFLGVPDNLRHSLAGQLPQFQTEGMRDLPFLYPHLLNQYLHTLSHMGLDPITLDEDLPPVSLKELKLIIVPCLGVLSHKTAAWAARLAAQGATVMIGPIPPLCGPGGERLKELPQVSAPLMTDGEKSVGDIVFQQVWEFNKGAYSPKGLDNPTALCYPTGGGTLVYHTGLSLGLPKAVAPALTKWWAPIFELTQFKPQATPKEALTLVWQKAPKDSHHRELVLLNDEAQEVKTWLEFDRPWEVEGLPPSGLDGLSLQLGPFETRSLFLKTPQKETDSPPQPTTPIVEKELMEKLP